MQLSIYGVAAYVLQSGMVNPDIATAIAMAESGGDTKAYRPASANPAGGADRGLWQINSKAHPSVTDDVAYDPARSTAFVAQLTNGGRDWSCWAYGPPGRCNMGRSRQLDLAPARAAIAKLNAAGDQPVDLRTGEPLHGADPAATTLAGVPGAGAVADASSALNTAGNTAVAPIAGFVGGLSGLIDLAGKALTVLTSGEFWRRAGWVVLGAAAVLFAAAIYRGTDVAALIPGPAGIAARAATSKGSPA